MMSSLRSIASLKLTLVGMIWLALVSLAVAGEDGIDAGFAALPILVLVINLLAALLTNRSFRTQAGLLVFHVGLFLVFLLAGLTVLVRFEGHVEVVQGSAFAARSVTVTERGWLHRGNLDRVRFTQGELRVDYRPQLRRQHTRSTVNLVDDQVAPRPTVIGDRETLTMDGYRIAATFNKGFAVVLGWHGNDGHTEYGAVHFPSYPENDWNQRIDWTTPGGETLVMELELSEEPLRTDENWTLGRTDLPFTMRIFGDDEREVAAGESVTVTAGRVSVEDLRLWMGYRIDYLPLLPWMLVAAFLAIAGLAMHYRTHYLSPRKQPLRAVAKHGGTPDVTPA